MSKRKTKTKELILDALKHSGKAVSHEMLQSELGDQADRATIYRALNSFCEDGIAHRIVGDDGKQYFAICLNCSEKKHKHSHFHFRCLSCGKVECLSEEISLKVPQGYTVENFNGFISGHCSQCTSGGVAKS